MYSYLIESDTKNLTFDKSVQKFKIKIKNSGKPETAKQSLNLVVDIYSLNEAPKHPYNHYTWQKFSIDQNEINSPKFIELSFKRGNFSVKFDNRSPDEFWKNEKKVNEDKQFLIQVILREKSLSNRIIFNMQIPGFKDKYSKDKFYINTNKDEKNLISLANNIKSNFFPQRKIILYQDKVFKHTAVGNFFLSTYNLLKVKGFDVEAYSNKYDLNLNNFILDGYKISQNENKNNTLIYFYFDKDDLIINLKSLNFKHKVLYYQNITDPVLFKIFDPETMDRCYNALKELEISVNEFDFIFSNSHFTHKQIKKIFNGKIEKIKKIFVAEKKIDKSFASFTENLKLNKSLGKNEDYFIEDFTIYYHKLKKKILDDNFMSIPYNEKGIEVDFEFFRKEQIKTVSNFEICPPFYLNENHINLIKNKKIKKINKPIKILSVCRKVPNKKIEDLIYFYTEFKRLNRNSTLTIVGDSANNFYKDYLKLILKKNKISSKDLMFIDYLDDKKLQKAYEKSDVYLTMSEHEGFGIPILEAAIYGCLVYGYYQEAFESILPNCKTLFRVKNFNVLASNLHNIMSKKNLHKELINIQYKTLEQNNFLKENITDLIAKNKI